MTDTGGIGEREWAGRFGIGRWLRRQMRPGREKRDEEEGNLRHRTPACEGEARVLAHGGPDVDERGHRIGEEHHAEARECEIDGGGRERVRARVGET